MSFWKSLFGSKEESPEEKKKEDDARNFDILKYDGVAALKVHELEHAIKCFNKALEIKEDLEIRDYLSQALIQNNELLAAYAQLQKLAEAQPDNIKIWERMARVAYLMEDYGAMSDACEKALLLGKDNPEVSFLYARACLGHGEEVNAVAMLTKTIAIKPDFLDAYLLRGQTLLKMGDTKGAAEDADYLVEKAPDNEDALLLKAKVEEALGHHEDAITYYNKVINANPFCIDAFKGRGAIRLAQGDTKGAEEDMKSVLELDPKKAAEVNGEYTGEGTEDIQQKTEQAYRNNNPFGLG
ncbi:MAG: tetratricopeptide repeat protein [Prevotella sp.]|jgi:tetratricopeptide (TPR) repeat protein|nr:tetratricopeptide repeat protein [Prevotella sp.]MCI2081021.1 tetratricopeptide repeat protein [Prevotella sp.]MCI2102900.1 tetratricopeptide repeat protein [Prevotella sp.]